MLIKILLVCCFFNLVVASELKLCEYSSNTTAIRIKIKHWYKQTKKN